MAVSDSQSEQLIPTDSGRAQGRLATLADFAGQYLEDCVRGHSRSVAEYRVLFPGHDVALGELHAELAAADSESTVAPFQHSVDRPALEIEGYELDRPIGRGGFGTVFEGRSRALGRVVAIKLLHRAHGLMPRIRERFQLEARAVASIEHPSIVRLYDVGEADGLPYLVMEKLQGETLAQRLAREGAPRSQGEIIERLLWIESIARGVHAAHVAGVVHRDLTPSNVMLCTDGRAVVLDFGLACLTEGESGSLTRTAELIGTPAYMSPEQVRGSPPRLLPPTDVWSLGACLYAATFGRRPYEHHRPSRLIEAVLREEPTLARPRGVRLPRALYAVIQRAMEKDPADRYTSVADLADDLQALREGRPLAVRPRTRLARGLLWTKRHPEQSWLAAMVVALAVIGLALIAGVLDIAQGDTVRAGQRALLEADSRRAVGRGMLALGHGAAAGGRGGLRAGLANRPAFSVSDCGCPTALSGVRRLGNATAHRLSLSSCACRNGPWWNR